MAIPQKIGKYTVIERIGRGGMGYVYRAHDPILKRDVALKTMLKDVSDDEELRNRFMREAQSAGGLRHPNIVTIYDLGEDETGCPYIAMEFLTGTDLEHLIKNKTELPLLKKLDIIIQTCQGLGYAHANGVVHRDIKTANIRLLDNGEAKIMDFGIAKITASQFTRTGMIMGTPHYMAPEQIRGEKVDGRADIFSLGVVLYELLVYRKPFPGDNPTSVLFKIIHENPEALVDATFTPPEGLEAIVNRSISKKPDVRYQTCEEMAEDLRYVFAHVQQNYADSSYELPGSESTQMIGGTPVPTVKRTGSQALPTLSRTPSSGVTPLPKTQMPFTLPSQARMALAEKTEIGAPPTEAQPTHILPQTQQTYAQQQVYSEQAIPAGDLPPISPTPVPSPSRVWWIVASSGFLGIAVLIAVIWSSLSHETPVPKPKPKPPIDKPVPVVPKVENGWVSVNIQPWAQIQEVRDEKGVKVPAPLNTTPCRLELPPGKYTLVLKNPALGSQSFIVEVRGNQTTIVNEKLKGFDYARAVDSLGL
ncbi:protein kinase [bacterium]|nr:protein kinase [bacterium]